MTQPIENSNEIAVLKQTLAEVQAKATARKARITELETQVATLTTNLSASQTELQNITINTPLRTMAESLSVVPDIWIAEFKKHFKVELKDGKLSVLNQDGEPALAKDGKPVEFTRTALVGLVTKSDNAAFRPFDHITTVSLASGGGAIGIPGAGSVQAYPENRATDAPKPTRKLGLR
ncbi:hypothetical protein [Granulicella arctica]|uniref:Uncharacterized protein n=1 Tax=Granulicella arctica TaxID=940613 RepID=A0A7Y9PJZ7_9BACT|nr:hypothetical protein [Granulicella arctica]NYF80571.1 hypothetical protein [Granulicella arctica]